MQKLQIAVYHFVRDLKGSRYPEIKGLDYELFKKQIEFFDANFNVVTMEQVIEAQEHPERELLPEKALLLTFDDGYIDHYSAAFPVLKEHGMQGSFFVPGNVLEERELLGVNKIHFVLASGEISKLVATVKEKLDYYRGAEFDIPTAAELYEQYAIAGKFDGPDTIFVKRILQKGVPERLRDIITNELFDQYVGVPQKIFANELYLNRDQLRLMKADGMFIGCHGYSHYWLSSLNDEDMRRDVDKGLDAIDEFIDRNAWVMNYPYGGYNEGTCEYCRSIGAKLGVTVEPRVAIIGQEDAMLLPRLDCNDYPPKSERYIELSK